MTRWWVHYTGSTRFQPPNFHFILSQFVSALSPSKQPLADKKKAMSNQNRLSRNTNQEGTRIFEKWRSRWLGKKVSQQNLLSVTILLLNHTCAFFLSLVFFSIDLLTCDSHLGSVSEKWPVGLNRCWLVGIHQLSRAQVQKQTGVFDLSIIPIDVFFCFGSDEFCCSNYIRDYFPWWLNLLSSSCFRATIFRYKLTLGNDRVIYSARYYFTTRSCSLQVPFFLFRLG